MQALHARTANGRPHWVSRLRAADMIFRLTRAYDKQEEQEPQVDPEEEARMQAIEAQIKGQPCGGPEVFHRDRGLAGAGDAGEA